jgi:hypothetical protein
MKITGELIEKFDAVQVSEKYLKREFVLKVKEGNYFQELLIQLGQDNCYLIDSIKVGEQIECNINLKGRPWTNPQGVKKWFNTLECWSIAVQQGSTPAPQQVQQGTPQVQENDSDLPF